MRFSLFFGIEIFICVNQPPTENFQKLANLHYCVKLRFAEVIIVELRPTTLISNYLSKNSKYIYVLSFQQLKVVRQCQMR